MSIFFDIMYIGDVMNQSKFLEFRSKYPNFYYRSYNVLENDNELVITYHFEIPGLAEFRPKTTIAKNKILNKDYNYINYMAFNMGLVELISYWKCTCSPEVIIEAGYLDEYQINWFKKLYYYGLGEFFYVNGIDASLETFMNITVNGEKIELGMIEYNGTGNMIAIGGGKDSTVSLELLKEQDNLCFMINPKVPGIECVKAAGYDNYLEIKRTIDKRLIELNNEGYLNGHTPFSAIVAFTSYLCAYLNDRKYIVLSNEGSANEATVIGTKINHQYSKTYEFEVDFNEYTDKYFGLSIKYFSLLRCLSEFQIGMLFANYKKYHHIFKSCNVGSKSVPWVWCCDCPKCLFVYIILSPFLTKEEIVGIFGCDLYEKENLLSTFIELAGYAETKPFECVGTYSEVRYAISLCIDKCKDELPYLLKYYKDNYPLELEHKFEKDFNSMNNLNDEFIEIVKKELNRYV